MPANPVSVTLSENREEIEKFLSVKYDQAAELLEEHREKVLELAAVLEEKKQISGDEVAEIMGSEPGSRAMREPSGWQAFSDSVAGRRQREALLKSGREVAAVEKSTEAKAGDDS